ncbi:MAG: hypothetical protein F7C38_06855 [Desulfurococcales archaeon]|nr:hypothetical protein [Desulfurococcales archaeon]
MSEVSGTIKKTTAKVKEKVREKIEPKAKKIRVLRIWALGPRDAESLIKWMKEGGMIEELLKENMELRSKYVNLEARLTILADRVAVQKLSRIFRAAREVIESEGED